MAQNSGTFATNPGAAPDLTLLGPTDWWTVDNSSVVQRKATGGSVITAPTIVGAGATLGALTGDPRVRSWSDGTPTTSGTSTTGYFYNGPDGAGTGLTWAFPADTTVRQAICDVSGFEGTGGAPTMTLTAHLSDSSAADYVDSSMTFPGGANSETYGRYVITYQAAAPGQTLLITWLISSVTTGSPNAQVSALALGLQTGVATIAWVT